MRKIAEEFKNIEKEFFEVDETRNIVTMRLGFRKPSDIFDESALTKTPMLSDDFLDWVKTAIAYTPQNHKIDVDICFDDLEGYKEDELKDIFVKNTILEAKRLFRRRTFKNKIAIGLVITGFIFLISMILLMSLWKNGGTVKEIISYVFDIVTTVTFWEALTILIVENKQQREYDRNLLMKFDSISFHKK